MKLLTFKQENRHYLGIVTPKGVLHTEAAAQVLDLSGIPSDIHEAIEQGASALEALNDLVGKASLADNAASLWLREDDLQLEPCVTRPGKIICVGLNYRKHAEETNAAIPEYPILFNKFNNTLSGHQAFITLPEASRKVDYEAELVIVIGKTARNVAQADALNYVFGYCNVNDLSARDLQLRTSQWLLGKTCDGFSPLGPYLVTASEIGDPNNLKIRTIVNGEVRQNSNTNDMIFRCDEIVSYISRHFTLSPGDLILTGTPEGVVLGYPPEKQVYLRDGDVVTVEIEKLGTLTNRFVAER
ncbi:fumarylacetoacetate hydrolase family protein [Paenibacillaceae bacterium WGS1546]|uniref:fumarylacetoacetate hydrolase family protein n=1 Tax=Cohnella sp. WGS1546 TaxID=3366810 RepID=UPI00372D0100